MRRRRPVSLAALLLLIQSPSLNSFSLDPSKVSSPSPQVPRREREIQSNDADWVADAFQVDDGQDEEGEQSSVECSVLNEVVVGPKRALIYDTTLRDGTQGEAVSASVDDKLKICKRLCAFGVDFVEAGWPGSNPKDVAFFERAKTELSLAERAKLAAFGSTRRKGIAVQDDAQVSALLQSEAPSICLVAKSHAWQVTDILRATLDENLAMIHDTVSYLVKQGRRTVLVDLEHFFDGYEANPDYAVQCCRAAQNAGASCLVLCDTNGGTMPWQVKEAVQDLSVRLTEEQQQQDTTTQQTTPPITLGIHCHNDCGMAVANSIMAVQGGVGLVQGTINGIGERTGNADLCSIVPTLALKPTLSSQMTCRPHLVDLTSLSRYVDEILNRTPNHAAPYVGTSAFAHKGGLHVAAMKRSPQSYQHAEPTDVGNESRVLISELSGRQNILGKMQAMTGLTTNDDSSSSSKDDKKVASDRALSILNRVKALEAVGYTFEGAEASVELMILHASQGYCPPFQVLDYSAHVYDARMDSASRYSSSMDSAAGETVCEAAGLGPTARATVKVRTVETEGPVAVGSQEETSSAVNGKTSVNDEEEMSGSVIHERLEVSDGNGPVDALANALMQALQPVHPSLTYVELVDYKVRILDPESATGANTRVMIEFRDTHRETTWTTVSVDTNVISASLNALIDGFEFALIDYAGNDNCLID